MTSNDRIQDKLAQIAETVDKLEKNISDYQQAGNPLREFYERQMALRDIKKILRKTDDIQDIKTGRLQDEYLDWNEYDEDSLAADTATPPAMQEISQQDKQLDRIDSILMQLDDTLDAMAPDEDKRACFALQTGAISRIKEILHDAGAYNNTDTFAPALDNDPLRSDFYNDPMDTTLY